MNRHLHRYLTLLVIVTSALALLPAASGAQELPPPKPVELPCAENASSQLLSSGPVGDGSQTLVLARVILDPGGGLGAHTHPGNLAVVVESGVLGFTLLDEGEMTITRAATTDSEATPVMVAQGEEIALNPGDSLFEMGMVHSASNLGDEPTSYLVAGLIETGQPLTACVETGTPIGRVSTER